MFVQFITEEYRNSDINVKRLTDSFFTDTSFMNDSEKTPFGRRLTKAREAAGYKQDEAARLVGMSQGTLGEAESQGKWSGYTPQLAALYRVDPIWLATGKGDMNSNTSQYHEIQGKVPLISWVHAGQWTDLVDNLNPGEGERIPTTYRVREHTYALRVKGDSMEPKFPEGCILIVEPDEEPTPGKYVIVRQNGDTEATFKQLVQDGGTLYLKPINDRYPILELRRDAVFCGVVKKFEMDV